ncbi:hypothetical protein SAY86_000979 [Trapa natans]|uniref:Mei2-like C-terminal RNA recognition motif domain-containing protein n=1 Tax=Trapa natans TaxID=22666 RepID=A0AAN7N054_TRANT|nr:hypothetical protein SAY86_000979 [Trapa natans]
MATSSVDEGMGSCSSGSRRCRGLNPHAEAFFPFATNFVRPNPNPNPNHVIPYPLSSIPPCQFYHPSSLRPAHISLPPQSAVPSFFPDYTPYLSTPFTDPAVLQDAVPAASYGRICNYRPRGRCFREGRGGRSSRGRGGRVPRWKPPSSERDVKEIRREDKGTDDGSEHSGVGKGSETSVRLQRQPSYERVVKIWRHRKLMVDRGKKPVVPLSQGRAETTVMIRNVPNRYTRKLLVQYLDNHCASENQKQLEMAGDDGGERSAYDFVYLPLDLRKKANLGYAFVNFTTPRAAWRFCVAADDQKWELFSSHKVRKIASARLQMDNVDDAQGKEELIRHFEGTMFACDSEDFLPVCFSPPRDGSGNQVAEKLVGGFAPTKY